MSNSLLDREETSRRAISFRFSGKYPKARVCFSRALKQTKDDYSVYSDWGSNLFRQLKYQQAISKYSRAVQINPKFCPGYTGWGTSLLMLGKFDEAMIKFQKVIDCEPDCLVSYVDYSLTVYLQGEELKAKEILETGKKNSLIHGRTKDLLEIMYKSKVDCLRSQQDFARDEEEWIIIRKVMLGYEWLLEMIPDVFA